MTQTALKNQTVDAPLDGLQATVYRLVNLYTNEPCCCIAARIARLIECILRHELIFLFPEMQKQYLKTLNTWKLRKCA